MHVLLGLGHLQESGISLDELLNTCIIGLLLLLLVELPEVLVLLYDFDVLLESIALLLRILFQFVQSEVLLEGRGRSGMSAGAADDDEPLSIADIIDEALAAIAATDEAPSPDRSEEHTSELQSP